MAQTSGGSVLGCVLATKPPPMSKILWHSNAPWAPTGYGQQTALFAPRVAEHFELSISAFYGLEGSPIRYDDIPVLPGLGGEFGNAYLPLHAKRWFGGDPRGGLVFSLLDVWVLDPAMASSLNMACWVPVDHDPAPPGVVNFFRNSGAIPVAMSEFGQEMLGEFDPLYVPHGVNADIHKPHDQAEARSQLGLDDPDAFVIGMVAANKGAGPSRKGFQQALEAFRVFRQRHDDAYLYLHTTMNASFAQGEELGEMIASLGIPEDSILLADQYRMSFDPPPASLMAKVYSAFDVLLNPSMGEGFGVPILEAQACGVPAIVTDFTAMKEVCGAGWKIGCSPFWTRQKSYQAMPNVAEIVDALEECYGMNDDKRASMSKKARKHAMNYHAPRVMDEHFLPALKEVHERIGIAPQELVTA